MNSAHFLCGFGALGFAAWVAGSRRSRGATSSAAVAALLLTAGWALAVAITGVGGPIVTGLADIANLAWLGMLYRLFGDDQRDKNMAPIKPVVVALGLVGLLRLTIGALRWAYPRNIEAQLAITPFAALLGLLFCIGALVLVHNLYSGASQQSRVLLRWPAGALATMWLYDLNLATVGYLTGHRPDVLYALRGAVMLPALAFVAIGLLRPPGGPRFQPSRPMAFQSFSLLAIGGYLLVMALLVQALSFTGEMARLVHVGFLLAAAAACLVVLPSQRRRSWVRVMLSKHLFQHRYDYRAEWLRFTDTIGRAGPSAEPLRERVVQAVADICDSPRGLLLTMREQGGLELSARWQWPSIAVPAEAIGAAGTRFFEQSQFIVDLDELRSRPTDGIPDIAHPAWLMNEDAWALVPLLHYERLVGLVVLARPAVKRRLDWEDFDLLRVVGRQLASYLAEHASQDALGEAQRFDEFNRRMAFVMHDIKNLASQLSLLSRNAERHAEKPEFRADMLVTLKNSSEKLEVLLARLGRYGGHAHRPQPVDVRPILLDIAARYAGRHKVITIERGACSVHADPDSLEQALAHLVHNAVEASGSEAPVFLDVRTEVAGAIIEVIDSGSGMSADFVSTDLFKPFHSSKPRGFGIGAYEARELIRGMGGWLDVESREGLGTRFLVHLPLSEPAQCVTDLQLNSIEVA
ncbi:MAG: XrtA/PEP-CTERM system histidine kinase PrsK [Croceibacterium sp.]